MSTSSSSAPAAKKAKTKKTGDKMSQFLKATAASVDAMKSDMLQHNSDMAALQKENEKMKEQIKQMQRIIVDKLGNKKGEKRTANGEVKKRKKIEFCNNYYVVATEFFNTLCPLIGKEKMKALGKDGINAWGANKDELKSWFMENGLDLSNKLKMSDIRDIIEKNNLIEAFSTKFSELAQSIKDLKAGKEEEDEEEGSGSEEEEEEGSGSEEEEEEGVSTD